MYEALFFTKNQKFIHIFSGGIEESLAIFYGYDFFEKLIIYKASGKVINANKKLICEISR